MQLAPLYPWIHKILKPTFPDCLWTGRSDQRTVALTFDDGPHGCHTPALLKVLDRYDVPASFFWLGVCVNRAPDVARGIYERGHWVGLHGYTHSSFPLLSLPELKRSLEQTQEAIAQACNLDLDYVRENVCDVRPPNGFFTPQILRSLRTWGYRPVMWSVVPEDWVRPGVNVTTQRVLEQAENGSVIVLHDGHCGGEDVAAIANDLIPALLDQGYRFVTIDSLWKQHLLQSPELV